MIRYARKRYSWEEIKERLDEDVAEWFSQFRELTPPQEYTIVPISKRKNVLVSAPTGSGKTLTVFISIISRLLSLAKKRKLEDKIYCIYVSPLRALNNDIYKNLLTPIKEIGEICRVKRGLDVNLRIAVRTGDTPQKERAKMLREPPHILITTPESLGIIITAPKFKEHMRDVEWIIIDEIHSLCENKRGVHLSLSLERIADLCGRDPVRIGLSATINPLKKVAEFLVGFKKNGSSRSCLIVDARFRKKMDLRLFCPVQDLLYSSAEEASRTLYKFLSDVITRSRSTLIFTNTRSGTERVVFHLSKMGIVKEDELGAHHSSLSREERKAIEDRLKSGSMQGVVSSTSLELGIDIGFIDVVVQLGSPKSVSRGLQRIGRSGHSMYKTSQGVFSAMDLDDLVEDAVLIREALAGRLDRVHIPENCLDVLAQHIVGMAVTRTWHIEEAYSLIRRSYPFRDLTWKRFLSVLQYLSGSISPLKEHKVYGKIWLDEKEDIFGKRGKLVRAIYSQNIGTIPDQVSMSVWNKKRFIGRLEEEFVEQLLPGDLFILAGRVHRFKSARGMKVHVEPADGLKPTVPSWFSELLPLTFDLGEAVSNLRNEIWELLRKGDVEEAKSIIRYQCSADQWSAASIINYVKVQMKFLRVLGVEDFHSSEKLLIEQYVDPEGGVKLVFHTVFGRRVNNVLSRALANLLRKEVRASIKLIIDDNGFALTVPRRRALDVPDLLERLRSEVLRREAEEAVMNTQYVWRTFRHCAARSFMILRRYKGHKIRVARQQTNAETLFKLCSKIPNFPIVEEAVREIVEDKMDVKNAQGVLREIEMGKRKWILLPRYDLPSPFAHRLLLRGMQDVVLIEDRKLLLRNLYEQVLERIQGASE